MSMDEVKVVVDAMGGDDAPGVVLEGVDQAVAQDPSLTVILTGPEDVIVPFAAQHGNVIAHPTTEVIGMGEHPAEAVRRKKDSSIILASQNIEDFLIPSIREFTKPLFSIPTHQFLFNAGQINPKEYMDALQVEPSEFELIKYPERGTCLFRCGNERYLLQVIAPDYKAALFGKAGGR